MSGRFRDRFANFMIGRYGVDEFGRFINILGLVLMVISIFIGVLVIPALIVMGYGMFRMFSRNLNARAAENRRYCAIIHRRKSTHRIFKCPNCAQKIRVPKGKGKICIKCPKCRIEFIKKT